MYIRELHDFFAECDDTGNPLLVELCLKLSCMIEVGCSTWHFPARSLHSLAARFSGFFLPLI